MLRRLLTLLAATSLTAVALPTAAHADHSWGDYHWARTANPFALKLGDNVSSAWDSYLRTTSSDWSTSSVLDTTVVAGMTRPKNCRPTSGRVEVCNSTYGNNGWLGIAQIWASGSHITQSVVKVNDTYYNTPTYNTPAWRNLVMCQEVGHAFGLDHQDESFDNPNLGTCMDYTNDPSTNQHPNAHDYEQLGTIYAHLDSTSTVGAAAPRQGRGGVTSQRATWGTLVERSERHSTFVRHLSGNRTVFTLVTWA